MYTFDKSQRLLNKQQYDYVFKQAKKLVTSEFIFLYRDNHVGFSRLGLALSKKIIAKAHHRNQYKRLLRETFRTRTLPAVDVVVLARKGIKNSGSNVVFEKVGKAWDRLANLCKD